VDENAWSFCVPHDQPIVAVGLLTQHELELLGKGFDRAFPIDSENVFEDLLRAIDEADLASNSPEYPDMPRAE
jgi:hypothetical protein